MSTTRTHAVCILSDAERREIHRATHNQSYPTYRPFWMRELGERLHPEPVTEAWYATGCPRHSRRLPGVCLRDHIVWRIACKLRGARRKR